MAKKSSGFIGTFGGSPKTRMSNVVAGDRTGRGKPSTFSAVRQGNYNNDPTTGSPVTRMGASAQRKDPSRVKPGLPPRSIDIRGYFGDERTGVRKAAPGFVMGRNIAAALTAKAAAKKMAPPAAVVRTTTSMKSSPAKAKAPARMAINRFTGSTLGFTSGKTTGSTVTKSGIAGKTTPASRAATRALDKGGTAGPRKTADGKNASFGFGGGKSTAGGKKK